MTVTRRAHNAKAAQLIRCLFLVLPLAAAASPARAADNDAGGIATCRTITDAVLRLKCFEDATSDKTPPAQPLPKAVDGWRMVRTAGASPGDSQVSMLRTADLSRSDPDLAGLALHCTEKGLELLVIVVQPFSPRAHPRIVAGLPGDSVTFDAAVLPTGAALRLPGEALELASGKWRQQSELALQIEDGGVTVRGVVPLSGLGAAMETLNAACPAR